MEPKHRKYCCVTNCRNNSGNTTLFTFPRQNSPERYQTWIDNIGREELRNRTRKNLRICEDHFQKSFVLKTKSKVKLHPSAIPFVKKIAKVTVSTGENGEETKSDESPPKRNEDPKTVRFKTTIKRLQNTLKKERSRFKRYQNHMETKKFSLQDALAVLKPLICTFLYDLIVISLGLSKKKRVSEWTKSIKSFSISLYYTNSDVYNQLREFLPLPSERTVRYWLRNFVICPGLNVDIFPVVKDKVSSWSTPDKDVMLSFTEVKLKPTLSYDRASDKIIGFENDGTNPVNQTIAGSALVLFVKSFKKKEKQPVAYYLTHSGMDGEKLKKILLCAIEKVHELGLKVRALVCDLAQANWECATLLGMDKEIPYIPCNQHNIYWIFDPTQLIKCTRDALINNFFVFEEGKASYEDIKMMLQEGHKKSKPSTDLAKRPSSVSQSKTKPPQVSQIFSNQMVQKVHLAVLKGEINPAANGTAVCLEKFLDLYESFNSRDFDAQKVVHQPLAANSAHWKFFDEMKSWLELLHLFDCQTRMNSADQYKFIQAWLMNIKSIKGLWAELFGNGHKHLKTYRFSQYPLENYFFGLDRQCEDAKPDCLHFFRVYRRLCFKSHSIQNKEWNCDPDEDEPIVDICSALKGFRYLSDDTELGKRRDLTSVIPKVTLQGASEEDYFWHAVDAAITKLTSLHPSCSSCSHLFEENEIVFSSIPGTLLHLHEDLVSFFRHIDSQMKEHLVICSARDVMDTFLQATDSERFLLLPPCVSAVLSEIVKYFVLVQLTYKLKLINSSFPAYL